MAFDSIFPFLPSNAGTPPQLFPYDVVIHTAFPGVVFEGTEPNALYQEIREVNGCLWLVTNAQYNENLLQWDQEVNQNTTLPAYALELCDGAMTRYYSPATLIPDTPITWTPLWTVTATGLMDSTPLEITGASDPMNQLQVTWDPGPAVAPVAREVDITDIDSSPNSLLDNLVVNGVQVWTVNKEGVLVHGIIPDSAIFPPITPFPGFNNVTLTGTTTVTGPANFHGPVTMTDGLTVTGGETVDTLHVTGTETVDGVATFNSSGNFNQGINVTNGIFTDTLDVSGLSTLSNTQIAPGDTITVNGTTPVVTLESTNGSIGVVQVSPTEYNLSVLTAPIAPGSSYVNTAFFGLGSTSGTFSIGPLPGTAANTFRIICWGTLQFLDGSKLLTLTGVVATGVTWDIASQGYQNSQSGSFPFMYFGNGEGGTTPTVNWTCNDTVDFTPMFVTILASIQL